MDLRSQLKAKASVFWEIELRDWEPTYTHAGLARVKQLLADTGQRPPPQLRISEARAELVSAWERARTLEGVSPRVLRLVPFFVFQESEDAGGEPPLAAQMDFRAAYLQWIYDKNRSSALALLSKAFLQAYPNQAPWFSTWRESLLRELARSRGAAAERWWSRVRKFSLLAEAGPERFCHVVLEAKEEPAAVLEQAGLDGDLAHSRFLKVAQYFALVALAREVRTECRLPVFERLLSFVRESPNKLRFDSFREHFASALLEPFRSHEPASAELKSRIQQVLLAVLGDPRIAPAAWHGVADADRRTMLRWLTAVAFETFMRVLDMTADERWQARREFWEAYLPQAGRPGALVEAWPVFGPDAAELARSRLDMDPNLFGKVRASDKRQSVLIMRLQGPSGAVVVCEWSHSGAVRLWSSEDEEAPPFYKASYSVPQLRGRTTDWFAHDVHGAWQRKMRSRIQSETGALPRTGGTWAR